MKLAPYPSYKPSGIEWLGEVPEHWETLPLKRTHLLVNGGTPSSTEEDYWEGEINWITPEDLGRNHAKRIGASRRKLSAEGLANCGARIVPEKSIVVSTRAPIGHLAIIDTPSCTNQGCRALVPDLTSVCVDYVYYALVASRDMLRAAGKGTTFTELSAALLGLHPIPLPPDEEQRDIADFLDRETAKIDTLVARKQTLIERLKEKRTALISRTVTSGLPPDAATQAGLNPHANLKRSDIEWLGDVPEHWEVAQLRRYTQFITSGSRGWAEYYADEGEIFVRMGNLTRDSIRIDVSDVQHVDPPVGAEGERTKVVEGDVLFSITAYLGSVGVADARISGAYINQHIALVRLHQRSLLPRFAAYAMLAGPGQAQLAGQAYGGTKTQLALDDVKSVWMPIPRLEEQRAIAGFLDQETANIEAMVAKVEAAIERLQEYRTALITAAVTGKIDVREMGEPEVTGLCDAVPGAVGTAATSRDAGHVGRRA